jgi:hypothetical protein
VGIRLWCLYCNRLNSKTTWVNVTPANVSDFIVLESGFSIEELVVVKIGKLMMADFLLKYNQAQTSASSNKIGTLTTNFQPVITAGCVSASYRGLIGVHGDVYLRPYSNVNANSAEHVCMLHICYR